MVRGWGGGRTEQPRAPRVERDLRARLPGAVVAEPAHDRASRITIRSLEYWMFGDKHPKTLDIDLKNRASKSSKDQAENPGGMHAI